MTAPTKRNISQLLRNVGCSSQGGSWLKSTPHLPVEAIVSFMPYHGGEKPPSLICQIWRMAIVTGGGVGIGSPLDGISSEENNAKPRLSPVVVSNLLKVCRCAQTGHSRTLLEIKNDGVLLWLAVKLKVHSEVWHIRRCREPRRTSQRGKRRSGRRTLLESSA